MSRIDPRGGRISGATPAASLPYERALAAFQSWRSGAGAPLAAALQEAPGFVMAHVLQAYLLLGSRDPRQVRAARPVLEHAARLPANARERLHLAAIAAVLADDYEAAKARLSEVLRKHPRDVLALQMAHSLDHTTSTPQRMSERIASVLPAWSSELPGYHAVLAMHAFALGECGEYAQAEDRARAALAMNADDARAHHAMAHVFEMTDRPAAGLRWMNAHAEFWASGTAVVTHGWWHVALYHLALGQTDLALALYDRQIRADRSEELADLVDATALLWRLHLLGVDTPSRFGELARAWTPHIDDRFCSFTDIHAMLAFVGALDWSRAQRLEQSLIRAPTATRHGATTRDLGLPACRGLMAFGRGRHALALTHLASLPALVHQLGGSHAQRDVLHLTLLQAVERLRRPVRATQETRTPAARHATATPIA